VQWRVHDQLQADFLARRFAKKISIKKGCQQAAFFNASKLIHLISLAQPSVSVKSV
jgi:hypothetical protein